jgi:hypothetical protein
VSDEASTAQILTPAELARQVEQLDDEDWYDFLDELDEVSRRRSQREPESPQPDGTSRNEVAAWVARKHFIADSGIREVWYLPTGSAPNEIRFLDVCDRLAGPDGNVGAIEFGLEVHGAPFRLLVADVNRDQIEQLKRDPSLLPPGWSLEANQIWRRRR